ncbi:MAG: hypothetical protein ACK58L_05905 [Planctomycetota bacterium]
MISAENSEITNAPKTSYQRQFPDRLNVWSGILSTILFWSHTTMSPVLKKLCCLSLIVLLASSATADEKKDKGQKKAARKPTPTQQFVGKMELTDTQKEKIAEIDKQFAERFAAINKALEDILTEEQKTAQKNAQKAARDAGKKGGEAKKDVESALKLTDDQKAKQQEQRKVQSKLNQEIIAALKKVLTEEQQAQLPKGRSSTEGAGKKKKEGAQQK